MRSRMVNGHEVAWDGRTVWVNSGVDGCSLARFSRAGIDVHTPAAEQCLSGNPCIACAHRGGEDMTLEDWSEFKELMKNHHAVAVPDDAMPEYLRKAKL